MSFTGLVGSPASTKQKIGRWLTALYHHLRPFATDTNKAHFGASLNAAQAGILLSRLRRLERISWQRLSAMAMAMGVSEFELRTAIIPLLESTNVVDIERQGSDIVAVRETILTDDEALLATAEMWESSQPTDCERAVVASLDLCSRRPQTLGEFTVALTGLGFRQTDINLARSLQRTFGLLHEATFNGLKEPYIYNEYLWGSRIKEVAFFLEKSPPAIRDAVAELLNRVQNAQGLPLAQLAANLPKGLVADAERIGLMMAPR